MKSTLQFIFVLLLLTTTACSGLGFARTTKGHKYKGDGRLTMYNIHLNEYTDVVYRKGKYHYNLEGVKEIEHALRCRVTHEDHHIHRELIELVDAIQDHFGNKPVYIVSGYRSPELNENLYRMGRKVSRDSPHMYGQAVDIRIPGVAPIDIRDFAIKLNRGGVGYYPGRQFVHVDVGVKQVW